MIRVYVPCDAGALAVGADRVAAAISREAQARIGAERRQVELADRQAPDRWALC